MIQVKGVEDRTQEESPEQGDTRKIKDISVKLSITFSFI